MPSQRRSNELVRGHFWFVLMTATLAYYVEGVVIHEGAQVGGSITGSHTWGAWAGGSFVATLVGHAPGSLRNLVGPLERREAGVTLCRRCQELHI